METLPFFAYPSVISADCHSAEATSPAITARGSKQPKLIVELADVLC
jgi:hypothetical protein